MKKFLLFLFFSFLFLFSFSQRFINKLADNSYLSYDLATEKVNNFMVIKFLDTTGRFSISPLYQMVEADFKLRGLKGDKLIMECVNYCVKNTFGGICYFLRDRLYFVYDAVGDVSSKTIIYVCKFLDNNVIRLCPDKGKCVYLHRFPVLVEK